MKNKLGFLSLLALLGFLGVFTEQRGYLGFFGFLGYLRYFFVIPDELFRENVRRAATPAFFTGLAISAAVLALRTLLNDAAILAKGMGISLALSLFVFSIILIWREFRENSEAEQ